MSVSLQPVSSPTESLILVDDEDREIGIRPKLECHIGQGLLHRAFSVFLFNANGELLLQKRSAQKPLWPLYWSNSCCSHPRESETVEEAGRRRIHEELNIQSELRFLYKFKYQASFRDLGSEHELCHVFAGFTADEVIAHPNEIDEWRYITPNDLTREIAADGDRFTPWLKMEWQRIRKDFLGEILAGISG
ncbi:MAG: isopentenyl-diphosphate Delta-isomerase [Gammaproteobacteria bacterium]|jgi:isopentenyl-diphosphate delta-isomerase|nr:isopentenyl-diphosphate Delta-isomerase [Gammaproteobacteria bacterium]MDP7296609.1 isopentenyl-diphosphate Delta-isomerase [Gammaproteobacteria bacterium]